MLNSILSCDVGPLAYGGTSCNTDSCFHALYYQPKLPTWHSSKTNMGGRLYIPLLMIIGIHQLTNHCHPTTQLHWGPVLLVVADGFHQHIASPKISWPWDQFWNVLKQQQTVQRRTKHCLTILPTFIHQNVLDFSQYKVHPPMSVTLFRW